MFPSLSSARRGLVSAVVIGAVSSAFVGCNGSSASSTGTPAVSDGSAVTASPDGGFPVSPLSTFTSDASGLRIELRTSPSQPPQQGPGTGEFIITDAATGEPVDGLIIKVTPYMPVMQHEGSALVPLVEPKGNGVYLMTRYAFSMGGDAEFKLEITGARTASMVSPTFDIPK